VQLYVSPLSGLWYDTVRGRTALIAVTAGESREKDIVANRRDPAGTGAGGVISDTRPYGYDISYPLVSGERESEDTYSK